jgi:hypothetical protein
MCKADVGRKVCVGAEKRESRGVWITLEGANGNQGRVKRGKKRRDLGLVSRSIYKMRLGF